MRDLEEYTKLIQAQTEVVLIVAGQGTQQKTVENLDFQNAPIVRGKGFKKKVVEVKHPSETNL